MTQLSEVQPIAAQPRRGLQAHLHYPPNVYLLLLFTLGKGFQISMQSVTTTLYVKSLGYSLSFVGLVVAMPAIGALVAGVPSGFLADRFGRKPLLLISGLANPLALAAIGLSTKPTTLIIAALANGFLSSAYWVINLPLLTESTTEEQRVGVLALNNFLLLGVGALGALIGGVIPEIASGIVNQPADHPLPLRFGMLAASLVVFIPALPLFWLREPKRSKAATSGEVAADATGAQETVALTEAAQQAEPEIVDPVGRVAITALFTRLLIPDLLFTTGEGAVIGLLPIFFKFRFGIPVGELGVLLTLAGLFGGATALTAPRFVRRWGKLRMATTMQYLSAPVMLVIGFSPLFPLAAAAELTRQVLRGLFDPTYAAFAMSRVSSKLRATLSGFYSVTWSLGFSFGPIIGSWLQQHVGLSASFPIGAACLILSSTLLRLFFGTEKTAARLR